MGSKLLARWVLGAAVAALVVGAMPTVAESKSAPSKIDPSLLAAAKASPNALFAVIVRGAAASDPKSRVLNAEAALMSSTGTTRRTLSIVGSASGRLRGAQILALASMPGVERVVRDETFNVSWAPGDAAAAATEAGILETNAPQAWSTLGVSGKGVGVAVIDSGVADHPDLAGRVVARVDFTGEQSAGDPGGHGTHVAGLIAGNGAASNGTWTGVAPQANIVSVRVIDSYGHASLSTIFAGMQWVLANRTTYNIKVVNLSFGGVPMSGYQNDMLASAAEMLNFAGLTVVVAAGNSGPGASTITTPATDPFVITVGAADDAGTPSLIDDSVAVWSSTGPTAFDGIAKPDLIAPGRKMIGLRAAGSAIDTAYPDRRVTAPGALDAEYFTMSGTSMAAPVVAGVAALYLELNPWASPRKVKRQLTGTAHPLLGVATSAQGAGVVDAFAALTASAPWTGYTQYPASTAFAEQVYAKLRGQPLVWRDLTFHGGVDSRGIPWSDITWDDITWDDITWEDLTWEAFDWLDITWEDITWEDITWETSTAPLGGSGGWTLVD
ncbi:MAG TPA: S8 family peptidase [Candidatus Limnocylindria bacterium]|nr:S8 family peptidase [Candidatus Limnocylindria bacterium]